MCSKEEAEKIIAEVKAKTQEVHDDLMRQFAVVHGLLENRTNGNGNGHAQK